MIKLGFGLVALLVVGLVLYVRCRGDDDVVATADANYDGVHLCSPSQQAAATVEARVLPPQEPLSPQAPYFAQTDTAWGSQEYDHGSSQPIGCGQTIAQCGCAMTSVATVMRLFDVVATPQGTQLDPSSLNAWFNGGAQETGSGWVSQGYSYGAVVWSAINGWKPQPAATSTERDPAIGLEGVRFAGWGTGNESEIRRELEAGRPVVLEVPGHFIAAVGLEGDTILINDPYYRERRTLDAYANVGEGDRIMSSRLFEPGNDFRMITVTVPSEQRVTVTDEDGRVVGTLEGETPQDAEGEASTAIPGSQYHYEAAWRDPTCTERAPPPGAGVNTVHIGLPASGIYHVVVEHPDGGDTTAAVHLADVTGEHQTEAHEGGRRLEFDIDYDSGVTEDPPTLTPTPTDTPTPTTEPEDPPTETPTPTPTDTATPTATPVPSVDVTLPGGEGMVYRWGESFMVCYQANRLMEVTLNAVSPGGVRTMVADGPADVEPTCLSVMVEAGDAPGIWQFELLGEGDAIDTAPFEVRPPLMRIETFNAGPCGSVTSGNVPLRWNVRGDPMGTVTISVDEGFDTPRIVFNGGIGPGSYDDDPIGDENNQSVYTLTAINRIGEQVSLSREVGVSVDECYE